MPDRENELRHLLCRLGDAIRDEVLDHRSRHGTDGLSVVVGQVDADVVYAVDRVGEDRVRRWLEEHWPADEPLRLVMEGIEDHDLVVEPVTADVGDVRWVLIVDPIDGTRNLMYDKRAAWVLTALAPVSAARPAPRLGDITVAAMTEIPTTKQWRADQLSVVRGAGPDGVVADAVDVLRGGRTTLPRARPSAVAHVHHGFASFAHYLPDGKALLAALEQQLWDEVSPPSGEPRQIFEDEYICSAGQLHEVLTGRDRLVGDLRPLALKQLGLPAKLTCHPYDVCTALVLTELGAVFEDPRGGPVDVPLDTTSPVTWVAYGNEALAADIRPRLRRLLAEFFPDA